MTVLLFDDSTRFQLFPFTRTRPVADIRCGILTMRERWELLLDSATGTLTESYLQPVFPGGEGIGEVLLINGAFFATRELVIAIKELPTGTRITSGGRVVAARVENVPAYEELDAVVTPLAEQAWDGSLHRLEHIWDIFAQNGRALREDFRILTHGRTSQPIPDYVTVVGKENVFLEEGAKLNAGVIINAQTGPVYLAKNAEVLEGCLMRGPIAIGENAAVKMGAKIYADTTIGPGCKVGGEISNAVFFANSNKGHDGFVGNAVIGEWCNLGADTNASNLKNNYDEVKIWDEHANKSIRTGLTFCGLLMGDHSKCGINTMFNTATVVGVSCNIYGGGFPEKFMPSYTWGGSDGTVTYSFDKAMDTARRMMLRRGKELSEAEKEMYRHIFETTEAQRSLFHQS